MKQEKDDIFNLNPQIENLVNTHRLRTETDQKHYQKAA